MTAKEIADALRTAKTWEDLAPLTKRTTERQALGIPVALEQAVATAIVEAIQIRNRLADQLARDAKGAQDAIRILENGHRVNAGSICHQTNYTAVVHAAELQVAADAAKRLLDVFAAIGDRIVATPEEQAKAAAERLERETAQRRAAWERLPAKEVKRQAREHGFDEGRGKASLVDRLVESGVNPE